MEWNLIMRQALQKINIVYNYLYIICQINLLQQYVNILNLMSRNLPTTKRVSVTKDKIPKSSKQNVDSIYLIQNENEILKLKNMQIQEKIADMKTQLINLTSSLAKDQTECEDLRHQIRRTQLTDDLRLQAEKKGLQQKIQLMKGNCEIVVRKISQARQAAVFEENRIPTVKEQKKIMEKQLWQWKTQNQGTKIVLKNLQNQLQRNREENSQLVSKRKQYGPKETQISKLIQQRFRIIKSRQKQQTHTSKGQAAQLLYILITKLQLDRKKNSYISMQKSSFTKKLMKKKIFLLSLIRKKYLIFIKNQAMQKFRRKFKVMDELAACQRIIQHTRKRRAKNKIFRIWRSQSNKQQYIKIRHFQCQATLQKFMESYLRTILFSTFNSLKYLGNNPIHKRAAMVIEAVASAGVKRCQSMFFSALNSAQNNYLKDLEVDQSAREQSTLLVLSLYFTNWAKLAKDNSVSNRFLKFKYFRQLKKLLALKKKRELSQMLIIANEKIKQIDSASITFCHIKKQTTEGLLQKLGQTVETTQKRNKQLEQKIADTRQESKDTMSMFSIFKISRFLKKMAQKAFNVWRSHNNKLRKLNIVMNMMHYKMMNDMNFGFVLIQKRKFQKLKLSIADKIQSCQFSYNYLVKQNTHIKQVLDTKLLQLQKSKFSKILQKLIRAQKQIKHKYFFKFLRSGYKCWKFKKVIKRIDALTQQKIKRVFMFLVKLISKQKGHEEKIQYITNSKVQKGQKRALSLVFGIFENIQKRNKKLKRILQNIFNRNLQLAVYTSYNKIKKLLTSSKQQQIQQQNTKVEERIKQANSHTTKTEQNIQILRARLAKKQQNIKARIILACRKIFIRNSSNRYLAYFNRWRGKLGYEKRVGKFVAILERKTRIILKNRLVNNLIKKNGDQEVGELRLRLDNFSKELNDATSSYDRYVEDSQKIMKQHEKQNEFHQNEGKILQKRTDRMDDVKIASFRYYWGKMICRFAFREWKIHKNQFIDQWHRVFLLLEAHSRKDTFMIISEEMRNQILKNRIRKNLSYIYAKKYRQNAGLAFKIWRIVNLNKRMVESKAAYDLEISNHGVVSLKLEKLDQDYNKSVNNRIGERKLRKIFDFLKKYTRLKIDNNKNKLRLETWLKRGYQIEFFRLFYKKFHTQVIKNKKADNFKINVPFKQLTKIFYKLQEMAQQKKVFKRLFIKKFLHYSLMNLYQQFFARTKNYYRWVDVNKKNHKTLCIQKVIETFDKKRKDILCYNIRRWRKNQYLINIGKKLFKRLTRKSFYNRYEGLFYAWKLQAQAKTVLKYHHEEGQVKKRKVQINRIQKFLHEFKKDKGLLLQNQQGNFVMSPRFQKKKEQQQKKDKNLRYKFVSRLIMSINGYAAPIKGYNNVQTYMKLREKYRNTALFVLNHLRRPDMLLAFRTWKKASNKFKQDFQSLERKQLIKILNKQKDKMEMQYSHKLDVDQKIDVEYNRYKIFSHQRDRKEKLCGFVLLRNVLKVKNNAFSTWHKRVIELREKENMQLAERGESRLQQIQQQIRQMRQIQEELTMSNQKLRQAVNEALQIAEMVKRISQERDKLSHLILQKNLTCESLVEENQVLNSKLHLAQKQAIRLLIISGQKP